MPTLLEEKLQELNSLTSIIAYATPSNKTFSGGGFSKLKGGQLTHSSITRYFSDPEQKSSAPEDLHVVFLQPNPLQTESVIKEEVTNFLESQNSFKAKQINPLVTNTYLYYDQLGNKIAEEAIHTDLCEYLCYRIVEQQPLSFVEIKHIVGLIAWHIKELHSKRTAHRDLKPDNILVTLYRGKLYLQITDFAFSQEVDEHGSSTSNILKFEGTRAYTPLNAIKAANKKNLNLLELDIYSFAVIFCAENSHEPSNLVGILKNINVTKQEAIILQSFNDLLKDYTNCDIDQIMAHPLFGHDRKEKKQFFADLPGEFEQELYIDDYYVPGSTKTTKKYQAYASYQEKDIKQEKSIKKFTVTEFFATPEPAPELKEQTHEQPHPERKHSHPTHESKHALPNVLTPVKNVFNPIPDTKLEQKLHQSLSVAGDLFYALPRQIKPIDIAIRSMNAKIELAKDLIKENSSLNPTQRNHHATFTILWSIAKNFKGVRPLFEDALETIDRDSTLETFRTTLQEIETILEKEANSLAKAYSDTFKRNLEHDLTYFNLAHSKEYQALLNKLGIAHLLNTTPEIETAIKQIFKLEADINTLEDEIKSPNEIKKISEQGAFERLNKLDHLKLEQFQTAIELLNNNKNLPLYKKIHVNPTHNIDKLQLDKAKIDFALQARKINFNNTAGRLARAKQQLNAALQDQKASFSETLLPHISRYYVLNDHVMKLCVSDLPKEALVSAIKKEPAGKTLLPTEKNNTGIEITTIKQLQKKQIAAKVNQEIPKLRDKTLVAYADHLSEYFAILLEKNKPNFIMSGLNGLLGWYTHEMTRYKNLQAAVTQLETLKQSDYFQYIKQQHCKNPPVPLTKIPTSLQPFCRTIDELEKLQKLDEQMLQHGEKRIAQLAAIVSAHPETHPAIAARRAVNTATEFTRSLRPHL